MKNDQFHIKTSDNGVKCQVSRHSRQKRKRQQETNDSLRLKHKWIRLSQNSADVGGKTPTEIGRQLKLEIRDPGDDEFRG